MWNFTCLIAPPKELYVAPDLLASAFVHVRRKGTSEPLWVMRACHLIRHKRSKASPPLSGRLAGPCAYIGQDGASPPPTSARRRHRCGSLFSFSSLIAPQPSPSQLVANIGTMLAAAEQAKSGSVVNLMGSSSTSTERSVGISVYYGR